MQTEHLDVHDGYGHMYLAWNEPAVEPPGRVPARTPRSSAASRAPWASTEPALYDDDLTLARTLVESATRRSRASRSSGCAARAGCGSAIPHPLVPFADGFPTPSGKLELYSERRRRTGRPAAGYTPPPRPPRPARTGWR